LKFTEAGYNPVTGGYSTNMFTAVETPWLAVMNGAEPAKLSLHCDEVPPD
jgi:hypothetical protein